MSDKSLLNRDAIRAMRDTETTVELGTVNFKVEKETMRKFADLQKDLTAAGIRRYPREEILRETYELIIELMEEDLEKKTK